MFPNTSIRHFEIKIMDQHLRDLIAIQQLEAAQKIAQQMAPSNGPKCPYCGGIVEPNYERCKNCAGQLSWVEGCPCKPGGEAALAKTINEAKKRAAVRQKEENKKSERRWKAGCNAILVLPVPLTLYLVFMLATNPEKEGLLKSIWLVVWLYGVQAIAVLVAIAVFALISEALKR